MIITVTMNPAIDKTVYIEKFEHGGLNRIKNVTLDAGGKGINVSRTIKELGGESIATGFLAGNNGATIQKVLEDAGITTDFIKIDAETRVNTKVVEADGCVTELNEAGPIMSEEHQVWLTEQLMEYAQKENLIILSGSVAQNVSKAIYKEIIEKVHLRGAKVFVDADGELFSEALKARPDIVKPNQVELEKYLGRELRNEQDYLEAGESLLDKGIEIVIVSLGEKGAYFMSKKRALYCPAIQVKTHSTVGAGDSMVAAFSYGLNQGLTFEECAKLAIATSAGAVATVGTKPPKRKVVNQLLEKVCVNVIW